MVTEAQVLDALRAIMDPDLGRDIVSLGFVKGVQIEGGAVAFTLELTTLACPVKERFKTEAEACVSVLEGVDSVQVTLSAMAPKRQSAPAQNGLKDVAMIIAVSSCKGGVGKSTVAAHLARAMQQEGLAVGLLDVDIHGPSLPTLFKVNAPEVYMEGDLILPVEIAGLKTMSIGYLIGDKPAVMRGPMASNYAVQLLQQTQWGKLDYLIIDLPPGTGDIQLSLTQQTALDGAIIVTTPQALSLVDVARGILMFEKVSVPVLGVVENMSCFSCDECGKVHYPFGKSAMTLKERFGLDTLAELPIVPGLSESVHTDEKVETEAFTLLATNVHREVGMRRITDEDRPVVTAGPGFVQVQWPDGRQDLIPNKKLRVSCQCALCVDEFTSEPLLNPAEVPENIEVEEIQPLGNYAVAITWSDGHSSGIFSWEHLHKVAQEGACGGACCNNCQCS